MIWLLAGSVLLNFLFMLTIVSQARVKEALQVQVHMLKEKAELLRRLLERDKETIQNRIHAPS